MKIADVIRRCKKRISIKVENINDYRESNNPELLLVVPVLEEEREEYELIVHALEKQIPKTAIITPDEINETSEYYKCPVCGYRFDDCPNYCNSCGQAIKYD